MSPTRTSAGRVTFVDARTRRIAWSLGGFGRPVRVEAVGGIRVYVIDEARDDIVVIDLDLRRVVRRIRTPPQPLNVAFAPQGKMWVARASGPAHDIAVTRDGAVWLALSRRVLRTAPDGGRKSIAFAASRLEPDDVSGDVFAAGARIVRLSPSGRIAHTYRGCRDPRALALVGDATVVAACRNGVATFGRRDGSPVVTPVGGAPTGVAVAVL